MKNDQQKNVYNISNLAACDSDDDGVPVHENYSTFMYAQPLLSIFLITDEHMIHPLMIIFGCKQEKNADIFAAFTSIDEPQIFIYYFGKKKDGSCRDDPSMIARIV